MKRHYYRVALRMTEIWPDYAGSPRDGLYERPWLVTPGDSLMRLELFPWRAEDSRQDSGEPAGRLFGG